MIGRLGNVDVRVQKLACAVPTTDAHFRVAGDAWRDSYLCLTNHHYSGVVGTKLLGKIQVETAPVRHALYPRRVVPVELESKQYIV